MPLYYFDLLDGEDFVKDEEGMDLPNISSAQIEAIEFLTDMVEDIATRRSNPSDTHAIEVRDSEGPLFVLSFTFSSHRKH